MRREELVCTACGLRFRFDDFVEELGEMVACPNCGSFEIDIDVIDEDTRREAA